MMDVSGQINRAGYQNVGGAWIHPDAKIAPDVEIEPGAVIGANVEIGAGCQVGAHAVLYGSTRLGVENRIHPGTVIGGDPQDAGYDGTPTRLVIGDRNVFREGVTVNRGSTKGGGLTRVGSDNYLMATSHIGHDCVVEDRVVLANGALIAGHCHIASDVNVAGSSAIVQFSTIGRLAFLGGVCGARRDLEPFLMHDWGERIGHAAPSRVNTIGLQRAGVPAENIKKLRNSFRVLYRSSLTLEAATEELTKRGLRCDEVDELIEFMARMEAGRFGRQRDVPKKKA